MTVFTIKMKHILCELLPIYRFTGSCLLKRKELLLGKVLFTGKLSENIETL